MAIGWIDGRDHVRCVRPDNHDLVDGEISHGEIFRRPDGGASAITGDGQPARYIPDMPGHQVVRHGLGCSLRHRVDDGVLYQRWQAVRHAQRIHGQDQVKGSGASGWGEAVQGLGGSYGGSCAEGGSQQKN